MLCLFRSLLVDCTTICLLSGGGWQTQVKLEKHEKYLTYNTVETFTVSTNRTTSLMFRKSGLIKNLN